MTLFKALTGGAFDRLNWQHSGDQNFSKKSNARGFARGGGAWAVLELTGTNGQDDLKLEVFVLLFDKLKNWTITTLIVFV